MSDGLNDLLNLTDVEALAATHLPRMTREFYAAGAAEEVTLAENRHAFHRLTLLPRVLVDVAVRDLTATVLGRTIAMPILIAPTAFQRLAHEEGEVATARAAAQAGTVMVVSTFATRSIEEVREASQGPLWFQLYVFKDRGVTRALVQRAEAAGYSALVVTADAPLLGRREADLRNRFRLPDGMAPVNFDGWPAARGAAAAPESDLAACFVSMLDAGLTWKDLGWLQSITRLPILVKGVLRPDDAVRALEQGAQGVIVSNHGGRQVDTAAAAIRALPEVAAAVDGRGAVLVDGGIRRGTDVLKALALGAQAVLIGRPVLWGLAVGGEKGVSRVMELLRNELDLAMALCGCPAINAITRDLIA